MVWKENGNVKEGWGGRDVNIKKYYDLLDDSAQCRKNTLKKQKQKMQTYKIV